VSKVKCSNCNTYRASKTLSCGEIVNNVCINPAVILASRDKEVARCSTARRKTGACGHGAKFFSEPTIPLHDCSIHDTAVPDDDDVVWPDMARGTVVEADLNPTEPTPIRVEKESVSWSMVGTVFVVVCVGLALWMRYS